MRWRDWLLRTELTDHWSGRVWEFLWAYVFVGEAVWCPEERECWCEGFGLCFGGEWESYKRVGRERDDWVGMVAGLRETGRGEELGEVEAKIRGLEMEMEALVERALERGRELEEREG